eukprot:753838-Hanusia_phi.AAC.4
MLERHARVLEIVHVGLRREVCPRPVLPLHHRRFVGCLPDQKPEDAKGSDVSEEEGMELKGRGREPGSEDADVANRVVRVTLIDPQEHAVVTAVGLERLRTRPVDGGFEENLHPPPPLVLHSEDPAGRVLENVPHQQLPQRLPRLEPHRPTLAIKDDRLPRCSSQVQPDARPPVAVVPQHLARLPLSSCPAQAAAMVTHTVLAYSRAATHTRPDASNALRAVAVPLASSSSCPPAFVADARGLVGVAPAVPVALAVKLAVDSRVPGVAAADLQVDRLPVAVARAVEEAAGRAEELVLALAPKVARDLVLRPQQLAAPLVERALVSAVHHVNVPHLAAVASLVPVVARAGARGETLAMSGAVVGAATIRPHTAVEECLHMLQQALVLERCSLVLVRRFEQPPASVLAGPPGGTEVHFDPVHTDV